MVRVSYANRHLSNRILNVFLDESRTSRGSRAVVRNIQSYTSNPNSNPNPTVHSKMGTAARFEVEIVCSTVVLYYCITHACQP